jgi:hypothetical protein
VEYWIVPTRPHPRVPTTCPSRFHCTPIYTILEERLGIPDKKAMKLLISAFVSLLLIGFMEVVDEGIKAIYQYAYDRLKGINFYGLMLSLMNVNLIK